MRTHGNLTLTILAALAVAVVFPVATLHSQSPNIPKVKKNTVVVLRRKDQLALRPTAQEISQALQQQAEKEGEKFVKKLADRTSPVEITQLKLKGQPNNFNRLFKADDEWVKDLSVDVKNISDKEMIYVVVSLDFPADETDTHFFKVLLKYGTRPQNGNAAPDVKPLKPGETITLSVKPEFVDNLRRLVKEQGRGRALKMNRANVYAYQVYFDANTMWMLGTTSVRDPITGEWKEISPGNAKRSDTEREIKIARASFAHPSNINPATLSGPCYTTRTRPDQYVCCETQDLETYGTSATQGYQATWQTLTCPVDCTTKHYSYIGTTPGCPSTCKFDGEYCNTGGECCSGNCDGGLCASPSPSPTPDCVDKDGDGAGVGTQCSGPQDCNDNPNDANAKKMYPGASELCDNIDNDCNGVVDDQSSTGGGAGSACPSPTPTPTDGGGGGGGGTGGGGGGGCSEYWWVRYECYTEEARANQQDYILKASYRVAAPGNNLTSSAEMVCYEVERWYAGCW